MNKLETKTLMYAPNKFTDKRDALGFFAEDDLPITSFLTRYGNTIVSMGASEDAVKYTPNSTNLLPGSQLRIILAPERYSFERKAYSFFLLLSDAGGFNAAIVTIPAFFMNLYAAAMY